MDIALKVSIISAACLWGTQLVAKVYPDVDDTKAAFGGVVIVVEILTMCISFIIFIILK